MGGCGYVRVGVCEVGVAICGWVCEVGVAICVVGLACQLFQNMFFQSTCAAIA